MSNRNKLLNDYKCLKSDISYYKNELSEIYDLKYDINSICGKALLGSIVMILPVMLYLGCVLPKSTFLCNLSIYSAFIGVGGIGVTIVSLIANNVINHFMLKILDNYISKMEDKYNVLGKQVKKIDESSRKNHNTINNKNIFRSFKEKSNLVERRINYNNIDVGNISNYDLKRNNSKVKRRVRRINT